MIREAALVLADGSVFEGELFGAEPPERDRQRRGGLQHRDERLPGGDHRSVLRRADHHLHLPAHRQLRRSTRTDFESRRPFCRGVIVREMARRHSNQRSEGALDAMLRRYGVSGIGGIDTRRLTRILRDTGAMPGAFGTADEARLRSAAAAEPGTDGVDLVADVTTRAPYTAAATGACRSGVAIVAYDFGIKRTIVRHLAGLGTVEVVPAVDDARPTCWLASPTACSCRTVPATRRWSAYAVDAIARAARPGAGLRDLSRPPAARPGARRRDVQAAVRPPRRQPPGAHEPRDRARRDHQPEPQLLRRPPTSLGGIADVTHVNLNDGVCEGMRVRGRAGVQRAAPPRGRARARTTAGTCSSSSPTCMDGGARLMPKRTDIHSILIIGSGPDRHRPGVRVRLLGHAGLPRAARRGLSRHPRQLEPGDDHDRSRLRRRDVHRAADVGGARQRSSSASSPTRCCRRSAARPG